MGTNLNIFVKTEEINTKASLTDPPDSNEAQNLLLSKLLRKQLLLL